jgi:acyl transferase domain-containing protein
VASAESIRVDPTGEVAIIGMACTFPGARTLSQFWENILNKVDAVTDVTPDRWDPEVFYDPNPDAEDRLYCKKGGWIGGTFAFNPLRFGIMPTTIAGAEPDHFLVLRTVGEALADAGYADRPLDGTRVSVILGKGNYLGPGVTGLMYSGIVTEQTLAVIKGLHPELSAEDLAAIKKTLRSTLTRVNAEVAPGLIPNICTGRVANRLDFMGRNFTVDAACASSLIAAELGLHGLLSGRDDLVLAGGVHIFAQIPFLQVFDAMRAVSLTSKIRPFDEQADGTICGEGIGILVLKRLADAERDGDRIYAVLKGVASASDGRAKSVTAPRVEGEELALRRAYEASNLTPDTVGLIEAHGTGTPVGDAAEIEALRNVFGSGGGGKAPVALGTVKSMIGHAMTAAGAAGLIKTVLALYHGVLPPTLNCDAPRKDLTDPESPFYVNTETRPWIHGSHDTPRRAGVNAFGFGGINAHALLEEYRGPRRDETVIRTWSTEVVFVDAETRPALLTAVERVRNYAGQARGVPLRDIANTLNRAAAVPIHRLAIVASSPQDLAEKLDGARKRLADPACAQIKDRNGVYYYPDPGLRRGKTAVLFPGEGSQHVNMLSELCVHFPDMRRVFDLADRVTVESGRAPAGTVVYPPPFVTPGAASRADAQLWSIDRATEAVLTADAAVFALLERVGVAPDMIAGHSAGEWIAMAAAGIVERDQFMTSLGNLAAIHRRLDADATIPRMCMLAVGASRDTVTALAREIDARVEFANDNCSRQVVVVVSPTDERAVIDVLRRRGVYVEKLPFERGYHSPAFDCIREPLRRHFAAMDIRRPRIPLFSCATAQLYPDGREEIIDLLSDTFARPLLFRQTIEAMYDRGARIFVESGPRGNLSAFVDDILRGRPHLTVALDQPYRTGILALNHAIAILGAAGIPLDLGWLYERRNARTLAFDPAEDREDEDNAPGTVRISICYPRLQVPAPAEEFASIASARPVGFDPPPAGGRPASSIAGRSIIEQHTALMEDFLSTHEAVMAGCSSAPALPPAKPRISASEAFGPLLRSAAIVEEVPRQTITVECTVAADEHRYLRDHCLYYPPPGHESGLVSMPMACALELMAETAALLRPGLRVVGVRELQASRWINFERPDFQTTLTITARRNGRRGVRVTVQPARADSDPRAPKTYAEAIILFSNRYPDPPAALDGDFEGMRRPVCTGRDVYSTHVMFHGPSFQGLTSLSGVGKDGVLGAVTVLANDRALASERAPRFQIDPFFLDAAGQIVGYWPSEYLREGHVVLPIGLSELTLYGDLPAPGTAVECRARIRDITTRRFRADLDVLAPDGRPLMRVAGWEDWRFYWNDHIYRFWQFPDRNPNGVQVEIPGEPEIECRRVPLMNEMDNSNLWESLWMHMILTPAEIDDCRRIPDAEARRDAVFRRAAAKDAVRMWVRRHAGRMLSPAEVEIADDGESRVRARGGWTTGLGVVPHVAVSSSVNGAVAVASLSPIALHVERDGIAAPAEAGSGMHWLRVRDGVETIAIGQVRGITCTS